ncbi:hypothetical protein [Azospirillum sp. TSO35-2]|uniref:hypothetical protein n=1 Tax=Azospirillum sp. TSO35-2 TaxID=716796 RepID=UPI000D61EFF3|nr:hypothetical protein [Azospirillum sp. TSO35-2]PWC34222.1 hypothetical protein TSO352_28420 [Azospirillum sp. TSO35-2]
MPSTTSADDLPESGDTTGRLTGLADHTSLMALDATLRALPRDGNPGGPALFDPTSAATSVAEIARRMLQATGDFRAVLQDAAE